jgi:hypothetical protein
MKAMFTFSLGGTYPEPPSTWRGTMLNGAAAAAADARNVRRPICRRVLDVGFMILSSMNALGVT